MARTAKEQELQQLREGRVTPGILRAYWPFGHTLVGHGSFDLQAEHLDGWVRVEGDEIVFDTAAPGSRATVEGDEIVVGRQ